MNRQEQAEQVMRAGGAGRIWKPVEVSVGMNCAPSIARAAMDGLVHAGRCVKDSESDTYILTDVRGHILRHLRDNPTQEFTAIGIAEAPPLLNLTEQRAMRFLHDLEQADSIIAFYSVGSV